MDSYTLRCLAAFILLPYITLMRPSFASTLLRSSTEELEQSSANTLVDLLNMEDSEGYYHQTWPMGTGACLVAIPMDSYVIDGVVAGTVPIYMREYHPDKSIESIMAVFNMDDVVISIRVEGGNYSYYTFVDNSVVRITPKEYLYRIGRLFVGQPIDINLGEDTEVASMSALFMDGQLTVTYLSNFGFIFDKVTDGNAVLWRAQDNEEHSNEVKVTHLEESKLVMIVVEDFNNTRILYYIRKAGEHMEISRDEFIECLSRGEEAVNEALARMH